MKIYRHFSSNGDILGTGDSPPPANRVWPGDKVVEFVPAFDIEQMILDCVPGGSICDPQQVADNLRAWVARRMAA